MTTTAERRTLYPPIEPYMTGTLQVNDVHSLYYEQCGNKDGKPVVFVYVHTRAMVAPSFLCAQRPRGREGSAACLTRRLHPPS